MRGLVDPKIPNICVWTLKSYLERICTFVEEQIPGVIGDSFCLLFDGWKCHNRRVAIWILDLLGLHQMFAKDSSLCQRD